MVENERKIIEISKDSLQKCIHIPFTERKRDLMSYEESIPLGISARGAMSSAAHTPRGPLPPESC